MTTLKASPRDLKSKGHQLRRIGYIPAIVYGRSLDASVPIQIDAAHALRLIKHHSVGSQIELTVDGDTYNTMLKAIAIHPVTYKLVHLDFQVLTSGEKVSVSAHLNLLNKDSVPPEAILQELVSELQYTALPKDLIDHIDVDLSGLEIGDTLYLKDLAMAQDDRYSFSDDPETGIIHLTQPKASLPEDEEGAESAETEPVSAAVPVIGEEE